MINQDNKNLGYKDLKKEALEKMFSNGDLNDFYEKVDELKQKNKNESGE